MQKSLFRAGGKFSIRRVFHKILSFHEKNHFVNVSAFHVQFQLFVRSQSFDLEKLVHCLVRSVVWLPLAFILLCRAGSQDRLHLSCTDYTTAAQPTDKLRSIHGAQTIKENQVMRHLNYNSHEEPKDISKAIFSVFSPKFLDFG